MLNTLKKFPTAFLLLLIVGVASGALVAKADPELVKKYREKLEGQIEVDLRDQKMGDKEANALAEALKTNKTVQRLNLNFNLIGEEGAAAFAEALSFNSILSELYLERNSLTPECATKEHSRTGKDGQVIPYTLRGELEKNKKIAKLLKIDPQAIAFLIATGKSGDFWLPKDILLSIAKIKAMFSAEDFDLGQFVSITGGTYKIGSPETEMYYEANERLHEVSLSPFSIMDAAVTQESYAKVMGDNPSGFKAAQNCPLSFKVIEVNGKKISVCADFPVESVSWNNTNEFVKRLSDLDKRYKYSLPTEAQLEVAFRGGTTTAFVTGWDDETDLGNFVWYKQISGDQTHPVKSTQKNAYGVYRSSVYELVQDYYDEGYAGSTGLDPQGPKSGEERVVRGGSWDPCARYCRSAFRESCPPAYRKNNLGLRLVRTLL